MKHDELPQSVEAMQSIAIRGNVIAQNWFQTIKLPTGRPDLYAMLILSDVCYWNRPSEIRCEKSGALIGYKKKYAEDMLRRSYSDLENQFGISKKQCQEALRRLEELGVIERVFRTVETPSARLSNVMFLKLNTEILKKLTFENITAPCVKRDSDPMEKILHSYGKDEDPLWRNSSIGVDRFLHSYGGIPPHHIETTTSSIITPSLSKNQASSENPRPVSRKVEREGFCNSKKMLAVWNELIPEKATNANSYLLSKLELALRDQLDGDISSWRTVCENFRSSKFLMGEVENQRLNPSLSWLVDSKEPIVSRVFEKQHYTFGDRTIVSPHAQEIKTLEVKNNQLLLQKQIIENDLARIEDERKEAEKRFVSEKVKALSPEELETYKTQYEALMTEKGEIPFTLQEGRAGRMAQFMFELFLEKQVKASLSENCIDFSAFVKKETELKKEKEGLKALYDQGIQAVAEFRNGSAGMFPEKQRAMQ